MVLLKQLRILLGPFIISWAPIFFLMVVGLSPGSVAGWRFFLAGCLLALFQGLRGQKLAKVNRWMVLGALAFAGDIYLWHISILSIGGGLATVLTNTQVIYMSLLSLKKREFDRPWMVIIASLMGLSGVFMLFFERIFSPSAAQADLAMFERIKGILFGLVAGMLYTLFLLCFSKAQGFDQKSRKNRVTALQTLTWVSLIGGIILLLAETLAATVGWHTWEQFVPQTSTQWIWLLLLASIIHIGGWVELGNALNHYKKATMGLILLLQPVMSTAWAWMLFGEKLNALQLAGAFSIFLALLVIRLAQRESKNSA